MSTKSYLCVKAWSNLSPMAFNLMDKVQAVNWLVDRPRSMVAVYELHREMVICHFSRDADGHCYCKDGSEFVELFRDAQSSSG